VISHGREPVEKEQTPRPEPRRGDGELRQVVPSFGAGIRQVNSDGTSQGRLPAGRTLPPASSPQWRRRSAEADLGPGARRVRKRLVHFCLTTWPGAGRVAAWPELQASGVPW